MEYLFLLELVANFSLILGCLVGVLQVIHFLNGMKMSCLINKHVYILAEAAATLNYFMLYAHLYKNY